jgi:hypothetical protein
MTISNKIYLEAEIKLHEETAAMKEKASKVIELPKENERQPDLQYFSAIFVSSGENLNHAYFLGSELVAAEGTIVNKALDVEHSEEDIIGHIYERAYLDKDGKKLEMNELASRETASLDNQDMHIAISAILYKNRFPNIADEVASGKFKVSMECYYQSCDVKIGDLILDHKEAEALGLASADNKILGRLAKVIKNGKEIAAGHIARVLRGVCFSGCGIVKNPANPPSIIMETAKEKEVKEMATSDEVIILNYDKLEEEEEDNNVTSNEVEASVNKEKARDGAMDDTVGICVGYKRRLYDKAENVVANDWCSLYEKSCTSFSRDTTDPDCLRNQEVRRLATAVAKKLVEEFDAKDKRKELLDGLKAALREAVKTQSR